MTLRGALLVIGIVLVVAWVYYHGGRQVVCPRPVLVAGVTVSCDGQMPPSDPTGAPR